MKRYLILFLISVLGGFQANILSAAERKPAVIPEIREALDEQRAIRLIVLATDLMFVRHYAADRQFKLKELEINVSLEPFNEKMKELLQLRRQQMDECQKDVAAVQANFFNAYDQLNSARYDISDYAAIYAYAKKTSQLQRKDLMQQSELKAYEESRPRGFNFKSPCIDDGMAPRLREKTDFISPNAQMKK